MKVTFNKTDQVNNKHARDKRIQRRVQRTKSPTAHQASKQSVSRSVAAVVRPRFSLLYISTYNGLSHVPGTRYIQRVHKRQFSSTYQTARSSRTTLSDHEVWIRSNLICPPYSISPPYIHYILHGIHAYTAKSYSKITVHAPHYMYSTPPPPCTSNHTTHRRTRQPCLAFLPCRQVSKYSRNYAKLHAERYMQAAMQNADLQQGPRSNRTGICQRSGRTGAAPPSSCPCVACVEQGEQMTLSQMAVWNPCTSLLDGLSFFFLLRNDEL